MQIAGGPTASQELGDRLPPGAYRRWTSLWHERDARLAAAQALTDERIALGEEKLARADVVRRLQTALRADPAVIAAAAGKVVRTEQRQAELKEREAAAQPAMTAVMRLTDNVTRYVRGLPANARLLDVEFEAPALKKGESLGAAIERYRRRTREIKADRHRAVSAPVFAAEAKRRAREEIIALARPPSVGGLIEQGGGDIYFEERSVSAIDARGVTATVGLVPDAVGLIAWAFQEELLSKIEAAIDEVADDAAALTNERRAEIVAECDRDLLCVEREEVALIDAAAEAGMTVAFRGDTDPRALLNIADEPVFNQPTPDEPAEMAEAE